MSIDYTAGLRAILWSYLQQKNTFAAEEAIKKLVNSMREPEVGDHFGVSYSLIQRSTKSTGPYRGGRPKVMTEGKVRWARAARATGMTVKEIARHMRVSTSSILRHAINGGEGR